MRFTLVGMTLLIVLAAAALSAWAQPGTPGGQVSQAPMAAAPAPANPVAVVQPGAAGDRSGMIAFAAPVSEKLQQIVVIDTRDRVMAVYHVELQTGVAELKSVRKIHWDLQMEQFNGTSPLPQAIRAKIEQLR